MNHLMPIYKNPNTWKKKRGRSYPYLDDERYGYILMHDILVRMTQNRAVLPHFNYDRYDMWPKISRRMRVWRTVIFEELYKEALKGEVIQFPFIGRCYAGHFVTDSGQHYVSAAFEWDEKDCAIMRQAHYTWATHANMSKELMRMYEEDGMEHIVNMLPIGKKREDYTMERRERKAVRMAEREVRAAEREFNDIEKEREAIRAELEQLRGERTDR